MSASRFNVLTASQARQPHVQRASRFPQKDVPIKALLYPHGYPCMCETNQHAYHGESDSLSAIRAAPSPFPSCSGAGAPPASVVRRPERDSQPV